MYRIVLFLLAWSLLAAPALSAQSAPITGQVKDGAGTPLAAAQVVLLRGPSIKAYSLTDATGHFRLNPPAGPSDSLLIEIRYFGFATQSIPREKFTDRTVVTLRESAVELQEVTVRAEELPITRRADTLIYVSKAYTDGTEDKVEDLLRKLPGVDVDEHGNVEVGGEKVQRVLVAGQDAFGHNYKMATQNINAGFVESVQVIDDYSDDPLTADLEDKGELVLNLDLGDRKRNLLFGELGGEVGTKNATQADLNAFLIGKKRTAVVFGQTNTLGLEPSSGGDLQIKTTGKIGNGSNRRESPALLQPPLANLPRNVDRDRYYQNETYGGAGALLLQPSSRWRSRNLFSLDQERGQLANTETLNFLGSSAPITRDDFRSFRDNRLRGWVESDNYLQISDNQRVDLRFRAGSQQNEDLADISSVLRGQDEPDRLLNELQGDKVILDGSLQYVRRINSAFALRLVHTQAYTSRDQEARFQSQRYAALSEGGSEGLQQLATDRQRSLDTYAQALYRHDKLTVTASTGLRHTHAEISTDLTTFSQEPISQAGLLLDFSEQYFRVEAARPISKINFNLNGELALSQLKYTRPDAAEERSPALLGRYHLGFERPLGKRAKILLGGSLNTAPPPVNALVGGAYLADYQSLRTGLETPYLQRTYSGYSSVHLHNLYRQFTASLGANWSRTPNGLTDEILIDPLLIRRQLTAGGSNQQWRLTAKVEKFLPPLRGSLRFRARLLSLQSALALGETGGINQYDIWETGASYQGKVTEWLKVSSGYTLNRVHSRIRNAGDLPSLGSFLTHLTKNSLTLTPGKKVTLTASSHYFHWSGGGGSSAHLLEAQADWEVNDNLRLSLRTINLLNQSQITQYTVTGFLTGRRSYDLRGRTLLVGVDWEF